MVQPPVIVVPGITATTLEDYYPVEPETLWSAVLHKDYPRLALHPANLRYEAVEPARVRPRNLYNIAYGDLVGALRHDLTKKADKPTPVFGFGYDWRQDCNLTAQGLAVFVDEVLERTRLIPHYQKDPPTAVDLVGHSMGGLIIARYLRNQQDAMLKPKVRRVVTIGTPFHGSVDSIMKLTIGMGALTGASPQDREREMARTIPALYQLLPSYAGAIEVDPSVPKGISDIFKSNAWQPSVTATLREFVRLWSTQMDADNLLQDLLDDARGFIDSVNGLDLAKVLPDGGESWLPIVGIGEETHLKARLVLWKGQVWFDKFPDAETQHDADGHPTEWTGDGTVPFLGACADFLRREQLVCVTKSDLSFWEIRDRLFVDMAGLHGFLPRVNHVQKLTIRFLREDFDGNQYQAWRAPGLAGKPDWRPWLKSR